MNNSTVTLDRPPTNDKTATFPPTIRTQLVALATAASVFCLLLGTVQSALWHGPDAPGFARSVADWLALPLEDNRVFEQPGPEYFAWGRWFWLIYAALWTLNCRAPLPSPRLRRIAQHALSTAIVGSLLEYGLSAWLGPAVRRIGFLYLEVPSWLLLVTVLTVQGAIGLRQNESTRRANIGLCLVVPGALLALAFLQYAPHAPAAAVCAAWALHASSVGAPRPGPTKGRLLVQAGLTVAAALVLSVPYHPIEIAGPPHAAVSFPRATPTDGLKLHVFNTGMNQMSPLLVGSAPPWRPAPAFVIEHPRAGLIVFDTGLSEQVAERGEAAYPAPMRWLMNSRGHRERLLSRQMVQAGLAPEKVSTVILSHLHEDHTGQLEAFPQATLITGPRTGQWLQSHGLSSPTRSLPKPATPTISGLLQSPVDLFEDGSLLALTPGGHTDSDVMLLLGLPTGNVLLAGDAVVHFDWLSQRDVERIARRPRRAAMVRNAIRQWLDQDPVLALIPGHDLSQIPSNRADLRLHRPQPLPQTDDALVAGTSLDGWW